jgi:orotidine-5'-phosphate decarboxylase
MFREKLLAASRRSRSLLCVGLDVDPARVPLELLDGGNWIESFNRGIVEATQDLVCAYKPNLAFYEALGLDGYEGLQRTLAAIPKDIPVIADGKRGDIGSTSEAYAKALFEVWGFDAATLNPYLGGDALEPFLRYEDRGAIILCKTSNPGSGDLQGLECVWEGERIPLYQLVARRVNESWNSRGNCGLVVGATYPRELAEVRAMAPDLPILIPGIGAQQGSLEEAVRLGADRRGELAIVNASRAILYRDAGPRWAEAAREAALEMVEAMRAAQATPSGGPSADR